MGQKSMRAGDADRQRIVDQLKVALDEGRLDLSEYDERVQQAYAAKTYGDLDGLLADLPGTVPVEKSRVVPRGAGKPVKPAEQESRSPFHGMAFVFVLCTGIWAVTGMGYYWPGWLLIPLAFMLMAHLGNRGKRGH